MEEVQGKKLRVVRDGMYEFDCPGCGYGHCFFTKDGPISNGREQLWSFNGDMDKPTISPSLGVNMSDPPHRCHSFIRDGNIQFLSDSFHHLAGQTVPIPDLED